MKFLNFIFVAAVLYLTLLPGKVFAQASIFLSPSSGTYEVGQLFSVLVNVNTGGESINAATAQINFDNLRLEVVDLGYTRSIFSIWTEEPNFSNGGGVIKFSGGVPNPGYNGASGAVIRVTFKPKTTGQATVTFTNGSVLANDGEGTNILENLRGALFSITPSSKKSESSIPKEESKKVTEVSQLISPPSITDWPVKLEAGDTLNISGLGFPLSKVAIYIKKQNGEPEPREIFAGNDGRFNFTYNKAVEAGSYSLWAKNVTTEGIESAPSETVEVQVLAPSFIRIGKRVFSYVSVIVTLSALLVFFVFLLLLMLGKVRQMRKRQGKEISEAEEAVHKSFNLLRNGLANYVLYLTNAKSKKALKQREAKTRKELNTELDDIEQKIEKEIKDI